MINFLRGSVASAALAVAALASGGAQAAAIQIDGSTPGSISFGACDFEGGMTINGSAMGGCGVGAGGGVTLATSTISFVGTWITPGTQANTGPINVYFTSASDPTTYGSWLSYEITDAGIFSTIAGSFTTVAGSVPTGGVTVVGGEPFAFFYAFMGAEVRTAVVSAPASLAPVGLGLVALGAARRRRD